MAHPGRRLVRQLAVATALVLFGGALSASVLEVLRKAPGRAAGDDAPTAAPKPARRAPGKAKQPVGTTEQAQAAEEPAQSSTEPTTPVLQPPSMARRNGRLVALRETRDPETPPAPAPSLAPPAGPSALALESRLLASAISKLRQDGDPEGALGILDQHHAEFGAGALAPEANATRIEALLRLARNSQALALLDGQRLSAQGVGREMLVARAELRADKGRGSAALQDFDQLLLPSAKTDKVTERAVYGRPVCRAKAGDREGARQDFKWHVRDFPRGRFADQARAALAGLGVRLS